MRVEDVMRGSVVLPRGSSQDLVLIEAPSDQLNVLLGREIDAHVVGTRDAEQELVLVRRARDLAGDQLDGGLVLHLGRTRGQPVVDLEHRGARVVDGHAAKQVFLALGIADLAQTVIFGHVFEQYLG